MRQPQPAIAKARRAPSMVLGMFTAADLKRRSLGRVMRRMAYFADTAFNV
jgi:hypothetical protein